MGRGQNSGSVILYGNAGSRGAAPTGLSGSDNNTAAGATIRRQIAEQTADKKAASLQPMRESVKTVIKRLPSHWDYHKPLERKSWRLSSLIDSKGADVHAADNSASARLARLEQAETEVQEAAAELLAKAKTRGSVLSRVIEPLEEIIG